MKHTLTLLTALAFSMAAIMAENQPRLTAEGVTWVDAKPNFQAP